MVSPTAINTWKIWCDCPQKSNDPGRHFSGIRVYVIDQLSCHLIYWVKRYWPRRLSQQLNMWLLWVDSDWLQPLRSSVCSHARSKRRWWGRKPKTPWRRRGSHGWACKKVDGSAQQIARRPPRQAALSDQAISEQFNVSSTLTFLSCVEKHAQKSRMFLSAWPCKERCTTSRVESSQRWR